MTDVDDGRLCSNCRAVLPEDADSCPECGVYAGDLYDERVQRPKTRFRLFGTLLAIALFGGGAAVWWNARQALPEKRTTTTTETPSVRVVGDRPGGARRAPGAVVNEAEAIRLVRRHLVETRGVRAECIAILGQGVRNGAYVVNAHDRCDSTRLGRWRVDGKSGAVAAAR